MPRRLKFLFLIITLIATPLYCAELLKNGDFSSLDSAGNPVGWQVPWNNSLVIKQINGETAAGFSSATPQWLSLTQKITLPEKLPAKLTIKSKIMTESVVPGREPWEMARVTTLFYDKDGKQVGGWPELGRWSGNTAWALKINTISVPQDAKYLQVDVQLGNCTGTIWAGRISVSDELFMVPREGNNLLLNGGFEFGSDKPLYWGGWFSNEGSFASPGYASAQCYKFFNDKPKYTMLEQEIPLDGEKVSRIKASCMVKTEGVKQGAEQWEKARMQLEFRDSSGKVFEGYPVTGGADGTADWQLLEKEFDVPQGCKSLKVSVGLMNCSGTAYFDGVKIMGYSGDGKEAKAGAPYYEEDMSAWYAFVPAPDEFKSGAVLDFSKTTDKPAGKRGPVSVNAEGRIEFKDGSRAVFWGTDIVAADIFRSHDEAEKLVKKLAKLGCNIIRLHHMDADWANPNIFDRSYNDTRHLSADSLDKLDYLVAKAEENGIYIFMDMLVHRKLKAGDGYAGWQDISNGMKEVVFYDEKLQDLTKEYITNLLTHKNKYTGVAYKDDPAIVFTEIVNESSLFYIDRNQEIKEPQLKKLDKLFNAYLSEKYSSTAALKKAWGCLEAGESLEKGSVKREKFKTNWESWEKFAQSNCGPRAEDTKRFYYGLESKFFKKMYKHIKSLGFKGLVAGSNHWEKFDADLLANSELDFIDRHSYWDHPSGGWSVDEPISFQDKPALKSKTNPVSELAHSRVYKKPFTVSEWNFLIPNMYRTGAPVYMAAYAALQGWDAMMQFNFSGPGWKEKLGSFCDISASPEFLTQWPAAVMAFRKGYVTTQDETLVTYVPGSSMISNPDGAFLFAGGSVEAPFAQRCAKTFDKKQAQGKNSAPQGTVVKSATGEQTTDFEKGVFTLSAPKIQGVTGALRGYDASMPDVTVRSDNIYASIYVFSIDDRPITGSSSLILSCAARVENTGAKYTPARTQVISGGTAPLLVEPVYSKVIIKAEPFKSAEVSMLDENGYEKGKYGKVHINNNGTIEITTDRDSRAFNYYIKIVRE